MRGRRCGRATGHRDVSDAGRGAALRPDRYFEPLRREEVDIWLTWWPGTFPTDRPDDGLRCGPAVARRGPTRPSWSRPRCPAPSWRCRCTMRRRSRYCPCGVPQPKAPRPALPRRRSSNWVTPTDPEPPLRGGGCAIDGGRPASEHSRTATATRPFASASKPVGPTGSRGGDHGTPATARHVATNKRGQYCNGDPSSAVAQSHQAQQQAGVGPAPVRAAPSWASAPPVCSSRSSGCPSRP